MNGNVNTINATLYPVILSGGQGKRLWPASRDTYPKQFISFDGGLSSLQNTLKRFADSTPYIIANEAHRFVVAAQAQEVGIVPRILLEPMTKNTAPAIALAAHDIAQQNPDGIMVICPSDHYIKHCNPFKKAIKQALSFAQNNHIVTLGITPENADPSYGYIVAKGKAGDDAFFIERFVEKPDKQHAESLLSEKHSFWNAGIFVCKASVYLHSLFQYAPELAALCEDAFKGGISERDFFYADASAYEQMDAASIDTLIMEHIEDAVTVPCPELGWSDMGSWWKQWEHGTKDAFQNVSMGNVVMQNVAGCYIAAHQKHVVAALGVEDLIIVSQGDAVLVAHKHQMEHFKEIVSQAEAILPSATHEYEKHYRPWGYYEVVDDAPHHQVKKIYVAAGQRFSKQRHYHRTEHWLIVEGTAQVLCDNKEKMLTRGHSISLPAGMVHCLENVGTDTLIMIEVQLGDMLSEDDIVRLEDKYGRV